MRSAPLSGITVLVTRPRELAEPLCHGVDAAGGEAIRWPALEIHPTPPAEDMLAGLRAAGPEALIVFVSRNAVTYGAECLLSRPRPLIAAIGPSTSAALAARNMSPDVLPEGHDTESLLAHPRLPDVAGRRVFIVRGVGGRELLGDTLREMGATVDYLEVYRRTPAAHAPDEIDSLLRRWRGGGIQVYTATSVAIYDNLRADLGNDGASLMAATTLVTASRRVVKRAQDAGHHAPHLLAPGPDDTSLLETIANWGAAIRPISSVTDQNNE